MLFFGHRKYNKESTIFADLKRLTPKERIFAKWWILQFILLFYISCKSAASDFHDELVFIHFLEYIDCVGCSYA